MRHRTREIGIVWLALGLIGGLPTIAAEPSKPSDDELLKGAQARIEKYRQADATVRVVDASGKPIPGVEISVKQTRHAFLFGCNLFQFGRFKDKQDEQAYRTRFGDLLNFATLPFYWPSYEAVQNEPRHEPTRVVADWCKAHGITTKGHPLAWNYFEPRWLPDDLGQVRQLQLDRITDCVSHFRGLIDCWDVVNESTHFERKRLLEQAPKLTKMWLDTGRVEFVAQCFQKARAANPQATLLINDYQVDPEYAKVLRQLTEKAGHRPFDVIGIQSHMHHEVWSNKKIWAVCQRFAPFGVPLHFTELTVLSGATGWELAKKGTPWPSTPAGEQQQAEDVARIYTMLFSHPAVTAITWWDLTDRNAWQRAPAGLLREDLTPKPAYNRLLELVKKKWWTEATLKTDHQGIARFRGFLGAYTVTVLSPTGKVLTSSLQLEKGQPNKKQITIQTGP